MTLSIDGQSATILLAAGTYTAASLAAEAQTKINGAANFKNNGISIFDSLNLPERQIFIIFGIIIIVAAVGLKIRK